MNKIALIVAGGSGSRMGATIPKQFLILNGRPVLMHSIERFKSVNLFDTIIVVLPSNQLEQWKELVQQHSFEIEHYIVVGGNTRFESVKNGLNSIEEKEGTIAIHDGVRPIVSPELIRNCMNELDKNTNAIPAIPIFDSLRKVENGKNEIVDRSSLRAIQTPQCFHLALIKQAYSKQDDNSTDDASVFENSGNKINLIEGEKSNIKITVPSDLIIAEALLN